MPIYSQPAKSLMFDWAKEALKPGQTFSKSTPASWFATHYPKIKRVTVNTLVEVMSINNRLRKHHPSVKPGSGHDLFYKLGSDQFRLWNKDTDPAPRYKQNFDEQISDDGISVTADEELEKEVAKGGSEFAFERDLRNYLVKNLNAIEPGLAGSLPRSGLVQYLFRDPR